MRFFSDYLFVVIKCVVMYWSSDAPFVGYFKKCGLCLLVIVLKFCCMLWCWYLVVCFALFLGCGFIFLGIVSFINCVQVCVHHLLWLKRGF